MTKENDESDEAFRSRKSSIIHGDIKKFKSYKMWGNIIRMICILAIFFIAGWKIYSYLMVLPPGFSIFKTVNGKIVIIFSLLCAIFHIIGSERAFAHLMFWFRKSEFDKYIAINNVKNLPQAATVPIHYVGKYIEAKSGNTSVVINSDSVSLHYINIIMDDEIVDLINAQSDEDAKRGIAIICKGIQIF